MSFYTKFILLIRSLIMSVCGLFLVIFFSALCIISIPILPLHQRYKFVKSFTRNYIRALKYICNINYVVQGLENIPSDRNGIILSKHQSTWETFYLPLVFHDPAIILKKELYWVPFFGWALPSISPIAINRRDKTSAMQQVINQGRKCLEQGRWILVFPEGTRIPYGEVGKYRLGGARLAVETGYPVIPVAHNTGKFWPRRGFIKYPGTIQVVIGPLMESQGRNAEALMREVQAWIENTIKTLP